MRKKFCPKDTCGTSTVTLPCANGKSVASGCSKRGGRTQIKFSRSATGGKTSSRGRARGEREKEEREGLTPVHMLTIGLVLEVGERKIAVVIGVAEQKGAGGLV